MGDAGPHPVPAQAVRARAESVLPGQEAVQRGADLAITPPAAVRAPVMPSALKAIVAPAPVLTETCGAALLAVPPAPPVLAQAPLLGRCQRVRGTLLAGMKEHVLCVYTHTRT